MSTSLVQLRRRTAVAAMAAGLLSFGGCSTDDAVKRDAEDAGRSIDKGAGKADERATDAVKDAAGE